ncbi:helix-turn-helix domain-containing protein [Pedobacter sp. UBA5917]|uniref:helix-turn-helix domain-containing protein n=1 Tax=Pedobacter sp. UBA5917 TaxID=1947061 RepID=UPI0025DA60FD|nr:AraC family transcriptional regulator [Pedobacter sp. UBA5917]
MKHLPANHQMNNLRQFEFKKFGYQTFSKDLPAILAKDDYSPFIKILFVKKGAKATVDFKDYELEKDSVFFINAGQYFAFDANCEGIMLFYNRDFYCVEIHDKEVACDGILFHNVYEIPVIELDDIHSVLFNQIFLEIRSELDLQDTAMEEMVRTLLKQLIIKSTRIWKHEHHVSSEEARQDLEFSRNFSQLVEWNYTRYHTVAEYADLLKVTPKILSKRISKQSKDTPNDLIKNRIILEAKRLLVHTTLSVKEIAYKLSYDDPSYFIRLFTKQAATPPQQFRLRYQS